MTFSALATLGIVSALVSAFVQYLKKHAPVHAIVLLALISFACAGVYAALSNFGYWETFWKVGSLIAVTANAIFNVLKAAYEALSDKTVKMPIA